MTLLYTLLYTLLDFDLNKGDFDRWKLNFVLVCSVVHGRWREAKAIKTSFEDELCVSLNDNQSA